MDEYGLVIAQQVMRLAEAQSKAEQARDEFVKSLQDTVDGLRR